MWKLLKYLKKYKFQALMAPFFKFLECVFELLVPLVVSQIIDVGIPTNDTNYILKMCGILIVLALTGFSCTLVAQWFAANASAKFVMDIKHVTFEHIQKLSWSQLDKLGTSTLITRLTSDMNQIQTGVNLALRLLLRSPIIVFGAMIMAFTVNSQEALVFVVAIPILAIIVAGIMIACLPLYQKVQEKLDIVLRKTRENLTGVRVIRAFRLENNEVNEYDKETEELKAIQQKVGHISSLMNPLTYVVVYVSVAVLFYLGAFNVNSGALTKGEMVALYNYMSQILTELIKLASLIITITKSIACGNRVQEILDIEPEIVDEPSNLASPTSNLSVEFKDVSLNYNLDSEASLKDISFKIPKKATVGIIGSTGSGKSSVVNLIPRFYQATTGSVEINGNDVKNYSVEELRHLVSVVPQKAVLFTGTVRSNLLWGNQQATDEQLWQALRKAQAEDFILTKDGLDTVVEQNGANFSGGQRQRLTIARALVRNPEIVILDDSASALDYATEAKLRKEINALPYTTFIVSQRTSSIRHADIILVMEDGQLVGKGTHEELLKTCEVYKEIYDSQYKKEEAAYA